MTERRSDSREGAGLVWLKVGAAGIALASGLIAFAGLVVTRDAWNPVSSVAASGLALGLATSAAVDQSGWSRVSVLGAGLAVAVLCWSIALG